MEVSKNTVVVDFSLLVPTLYLTESLLQNYQQQKYIMALLDFVVTNNANLGKTALIDWLHTTPFPYTKQIEHILRTTPLGNPAWGLFGSDSFLTKQLIAALEHETLLVSENKSLKSLIKEFLIKYPQYGAVPYLDIKSVTTFRNGLEVYEKETKSWEPRFLLGDVITRLMLFQAAALPKSVKLKKEEAIRLDPNAKLDGIKGDDSHINRPDTAYYMVALKDLLVGMVEIPDTVWQEMVSLYMGTKLTNFLAFAPILYQPFAHSTLNIPLPTINSLATIMGNYTGATGTFMGEITRSKKVVEWQTLGLTIGKLCEKIGKVPEIDLHTSVDKIEQTLLNLSPNLNSKTRICGYAEGLPKHPELGVDVGHVILHKDLLMNRWDINIIDIKNSVINENIKYYNFVQGKRSLVFYTPYSLKRLDHWRRMQTKQSFICTQLVLFEGCSFIPSTRDLKTSNYSVLPFFTYQMRQEQKALKTKRRNLKKSLEPQMVKFDDMNSKSDDCLYKFFIAETFERDRYKKHLVLSKMNELFNLNELRLKYAALLDLTVEDLKGFNFRTHLNYLELTAVNTWFGLDQKEAPPKAPKTVRNLWTAMTFLWITYYIENEEKKGGSPSKNMWDYDMYRLFPITSFNRKAVLSLVPLLLKQCFTPIDSIYWSMQDNKVPTNVTVSYDSIRYTSVDDWRPELILEEAERYYGKYDHNMCSATKQKVVDHVQESVITLIKELKNKNLASYLNYISPTDMDMRTVFKCMVEEIKYWFKTFLDSVAMPNSL